MSDLSEMRRVAEAATPGPWELRDGHEDMPPTRFVRIWHAPSRGESFTFNAGFAPDAAHIATFDPPTVLALLDANERQASEIERLRKYVEWMRGKNPTSNSAWDSLRVREEMVERARAALNEKEPDA